MRHLAVIAAVVSLAPFACAPRYQPIRLDASADADDLMVRSMLEQHAQTLPRHVDLVQSVVFRKAFFSISALGYTEIDRQANRFALVGLSPMGVKLFEIKGNSTTIEHAFAIKAFSERGDFSRVLYQDVKAIYFDLEPSPDSRVRIKKRAIHVRSQRGTDETEFIFDRQSGRLREKRFRHHHRRLWRVVFSDYRLIHGAWVPGEIRFKHHAHHYQLILRLKDVK